MAFNASKGLYYQNIENILRKNSIDYIQSHLTYRFFKAVNAKEGKLKMRRKGFQLEEPDLIGLDYLWRVRKLFNINGYIPHSCQYNKLKSSGYLRMYRRYRNVWR